MGQYWLPVNLDKREFVHPHRLGAGLKLWEQIGNHPGTAAALVILCAAMPERRGGGDLEIMTGSSEKIIGRWAGDRIAIVGDYAEDGDLPGSPVPASSIYSLCMMGRRLAEGEALTEHDRDELAEAGLHGSDVFQDISELVCRQIEHELEGKFEGTGWRSFKRNDEPVPS